MGAATDALVRDSVLSTWLFKHHEVTHEGQATSPEPATTAPVSPSTKPTDQNDLILDPMTTLPPTSCCFPRLSPTKTRKPPAFPRDNETTQAFLRSCAGYCVATYVLGVGDRHNDNLMLQQCGKFFHIDFGHFLGHFKPKFGIKRERAPFVFTPAMLHALGGRHSEAFAQFQQLACQAFEVLRHQSNLLITLLVLALTCGIPELGSARDIHWVHRTLMLDLSDEQARKQFVHLIDVALHTKTTQFNDAVHLMAH